MLRHFNSSFVRRFGFGSAVAASVIAVFGLTVRGSQQDAKGTAETAAAPKQTTLPAPSLASTISAVQEARDLVEVLEARLDIKKAELRECEVHLAQAKRRMIAVEHMQRADYMQALDRVRWAEGMQKKGYYTENQVKQERQRAEQLNPTPGR